MNDSARITALEIQTARLEEQMKTAFNDLEEIKTDARATRTGVAAIQSKIDKGEGGMKVLGIGLTVAGTGVGALAIKVLDKIWP